MAIIVYMLFLSITAQAADGMAVSAEYGASERILYPSSVRVLRKKDLPESTITVSDWLTRESGLHISQTGSGSAPSTVSIRGSTGEQVAVYVNGVLLNSSAGGGAVNLSQFSLTQVDRISIYKGKIPLSLGGDPVGGAIFIETTPPSPHPLPSREGEKRSHPLDLEQKSNSPPRRERGRVDHHANALLRYGSFGSIEGYAAYGENRTGFDWQSSYNATHSEGDFSFLDDNGTPANPDDDVTRRRENNASTVHDWLSTFRYTPFPDGELDFFQRVLREDRGIPGLGSFQSESADLSNTQTLSALTWHWKGLFIPSLDYRQKNSFTFEKSQFSDPNAEVGIGDPQDNDDDRFHYTHEEFLEWQQSPVILRLLGTYDWESFRPESFLDDPEQGPESARHRFGFGGELESRLWNERLFLSASLSYLQLRNGLNDADPSSTAASGFLNTQVEHLGTGGLAMEWAVIRDWLWIDSSLVRAVRPPQFFELFGDRGGVVGNPTLDAEKSVSGTVGARVGHSPRNSVLREFFLTTAYFRRENDNLIQFIDSNSVARAENIGESMAQGLEISALIALTDHLRIDNAFTLQEVVDESTGNAVPGHPRYEASSGIDFRYPLGHGEFRAFTHWHYEDERFLDRNNSRQVIHQQRLDLGGSYRFLKHYRVFVEAKNLTGDQLVDVVGFPLPGRAIYGGIAWEWDNYD